MTTTATDDDRAHFCTYDQAIAAIPDELPFRSNGHRHVAVNLSTGHRIPCADAFMASGYVAGSAVLFPQWSFALEMGAESIKAFAAHPSFNLRVRNPRWREDEQTQHDAATYDRALRSKAQRAYEAVMAQGLTDDDY